MAHWTKRYIDCRQSPHPVSVSKPLSARPPRNRNPKLPQNLSWSRSQTASRRKTLAEPIKIRLKKNDVVKVITGRDKGKQGRVIEIDRRTGKIVVEHVMMMKRHTKPNPAKQIKGGIAERESPIHVSNVKKLEKE